MPSKKFSKYVCVYCQENVSTPTGDHIFARQFFTKADRANLPKAPSCLVCGTRKSVYEHYLATVLPFGGLHAANSEALNTLVPSRLRKNEKLHRELRASYEPSSENSPMVIPFDPVALQNLFNLVTRALLWFHWKLYLPPEYEVQCALLSPDGERYFEKLLAMRSVAQESVDLGNGTFRYQAAQGTDPNFSVWRYQIYGGLQLMGDPNYPGVRTQLVGCISGQSDFLAKNPLA